MFFFNKKNVRISIRDKKLVVETKAGVNLYKFLRQEKIIAKTLCDGSGQCGKCKILFLGNVAPKPTYKETLILAKVNIEAGYRLACQHTVKKDIEIDTSELMALQSGPYFSDYPKALKDPGGSGARKDFRTVKQEEIPPADDGLRDAVTDQTADDRISITEFKPAATKERPVQNHSEEGPSDGVFMIQQRNGVRYFCYSAALDNIVSEGTAESNDSLKDVIDNNLVSDFIHNVLKIKDVDRVLMLIEYSDSYPADNILDMARYFKFEVGTLLCEVIMPHKDNHDIIRFCRLLNADKNNRLAFSLDMMDRTYFLTEKLTTDMRYTSLGESNLLAIFPKGTNPITDFDDNLCVKSIEKKGLRPDGVALSAFLKFVKLLHKKGIIDNDFKIRSRTDLARQGISLDLAVRIAGKETSTGFYMFRDRFGELILSQERLFILAEIRDYAVAVIRYVQARLGRIGCLAFYTNAAHDNLINLLFDLGFIPKEFAEKTSYIPGEATVQAIKLFKEKNISKFVERRFDNVLTRDLEDDADFIFKKERFPII